MAHCRSLLLGSTAALLSAGRATDKEIGDEAQRVVTLQHTPTQALAEMTRIAETLMAAEG